MPAVDPAPAEMVTADYGDCGVLLTFLHPDAEQRWVAAQSKQSLLLGHRDAGVVDVVASFDTAFVTFDPLRIDHEGVRELARLADRGADAPRPARDFSIPVVYGGERGPDLVEVATELGLTPAELVRRHTAEPWTVRFRGSPAAAPFLDGPEMPASVRRRASPRTRVPPGSVALSGQQSMIYPVDSPGGWRLIGQTPVRFLDLERDDLVPYRPGDRFRFDAVEESDWERWTGLVQ